MKKEIFKKKLDHKEALQFAQKHGQLDFYYGNIKSKDKGYFWVAGDIESKKKVGCILYWHALSPNAGLI